MVWYQEFDTQAERAGLAFERDVPMSRYTTFRIGGPARRMAFPASAEQAAQLVEIAQTCGVQPLITGNGSNLLVSDQGIDRLVIHTARNLTHLCVEGTSIRTGSGTTLARLADFAWRNGLTGLEFAHGIPGTVGGGIYMNAGAYGGEIRQVVSSVTLLKPGSGVQTLSGDAMDFAYRHSILAEHPDWIVLEAVFTLSPGDPQAIRATMDDLLARRRASQPLEYPSAGSTFKRPEGFYAGTLIDQCGLKGLSVGGAQVSEKHAGFVINTGGASCADVRTLIARVQERVYAEKGVRLEPEVRMVEQ